MHGNLYAYRAHIPSSPADGGLDSTRFDSYWFGAEQRFVYSPSPLWQASVGSEVQAFPKADTHEANELDREYLDDEQRLLLAAVYGSLDVRPLAALKLSAAARLDYYSNFGAALPPL
jgi:hypothetical protein